MKKFVFSALAILGIVLGIMAPAHADTPWQERQSQASDGGGGAQ